MTKLIAGKVALVTGGASGIGRAICRSLAEHGAKAVIVADLHTNPREGGTPVGDLITAGGAAFEFRQTDVRSKPDLERAVAAAEPYGGLDLMVCNAGVTVGGDGLSLEEAELRRLVDINQLGVFFSAQTAAAHMTTWGKAGSIVIISSMGGVRGSSATVSYSATKAAGRLMAASMADELGPRGIRVNAVCPGLIDTALLESNPAVAEQIAGLLQRTPLRRSGRPEEVGAVVAWLGSDLASYVTGASLVVDGGLTAVL